MYDGTIELDNNYWSTDVSLIMQQSMILITCVSLGSLIYANAIKLQNNK